MTGCKILLAQKAFSMYSTYPLISGYLSGTTASGLYEARLGYEYFGNETHVFSPAYTDSEINELAKYAGHFVFNSIRQFALHRDAVKDKHCLIRVNPRFPRRRDTRYTTRAPRAQGSDRRLLHLRRI